MERSFQGAEACSLQKRRKCRTGQVSLYLHNVHASQRMRKGDCVTRRRFRSDCCMFLSFWDAFLGKKQGGQPNQRPPVSKWWRRRSFSTGVMGLSGGCKCENIGSSKMLSSPGVKTLGPRRHFMWFHKGLGKRFLLKVICYGVREASIYQLVTIFANRFPISFR